MELVKNIFFNTDKLTQNSTVKISYVGYLFQINSTEVYLHYGFGPSWENAQDIKMEKTDLGFQCEIGLGENESLNLCFKNEIGEWDNCFGQNFAFPIEKVEVELEEPSLSLIATPETGMAMHKGLRKSYIWSKKIRLAVYKLITYIPKIISGNYKRKVTD